MLTVLAFLGGTVLAFRFNVLILLPTILFGWMLILVGGVLADSSGFSITLRMALVTIVLQVSYVAGNVLIWAWVASWRGSWSKKSAVSPDGAF